MTQNLVRYAALVPGTAVLVRWPDNWEPATVLLATSTRVRVTTHFGEETGWAAVTCVQTHVDYPHEPGYLIDCVACEYACHCEDGTCLSCENEIATPVEEWEERFMDEAQAAYDNGTDAAGDWNYPETDLGDEW